MEAKEAVKKLRKEAVKKLIQDFNFPENTVVIENFDSVKIGISKEGGHQTLYGTDFTILFEDTRMQNPARIKSASLEFVPNSKEAGDLKFLMMGITISNFEMLLIILEDFCEKVQKIHDSFTQN